MALPSGASSIRADQAVSTIGATPQVATHLPQVIPEDPQPTSLNLHDELLRWHYHLGHLPFERIKQLARSGQLPKRLLTCKKPFCVACQYGKMAKRPCRVKGDSKQTTKVATRPGQIVSVDQLESNSPGLIAQLKGKLTQ